MSSLDKAMRVIAKHLGELDPYFITAGQTAANLKYAGILMPDLPEPKRPGFWEVDGLEINLVDKDGDVCIEWEADSDYIYGTQTRTLWLNRDQVLAILAAANHAEPNLK